MGCEPFRALIADYMDGALEAPAARRLEEHLASCTACADALRADEAFVAHLRGATDVTMPDDAKARLRRLLALRDRQS